MGEPQIQTDSEWKRLYEVIIHKAYCMGYGYEAEDIAQSIIERRLKGNYHRSQLINHSIVDYVRSEFGRPGSHKYDVKQSTHTRADFPEVETDWERFEALLDVEKLIMSLKPRFRVILTAIMMGFTQREIANRLNLSDSRVGHLRTAALEELQREAGVNENEHRRFEFYSDFIRELFSPRE